MILFFNSVDSVFKRLQFEWFKLLLSVPFLQLEWGRLCSDISFWAVKQALAMRNQLFACVINWMDYRQIDWMWFRADWHCTDQGNEDYFFVIWTRLIALRLVSLTCEHSLLSSLLSARDVFVLRCRWCARVRWDQEKNSLEEQKGTSTKGAFWPINFEQEGPSSLRYNLLYALFFFLDLCIYSRRLLFYQCYPPGIALLIVGNTVINYFQIG